ncbi:outer membrane protein transport protein [Vibrio vulnificus]|uniref:outer membrane protein transport protein n=1 Tax=Vibrio vulnificus TaxID=672 RepID=UPI000721AE9C|nr:outer membrane protein transport protein [Vibrio vulnificus]ALM70261.1 Long-chain fatty acid transport protein [Vibrio vulnificus]ANH63933.1 Long-chain fatty acid transport protein [Vibrio vulnificus]
MTQNMRLFKKSLLAVTVALASGQTMAAGFQLNAQSATGIGRAFAGDAVIADNAAVMARNPAAMALFDEKALSLGFESITSMIEVKDVTYTSKVAGNVPVSDTDDVGDTSIAPNIHFIYPINEKFAVGVNAYSNFGTKTEFSDDYAASEFGGLTDVKSANFGVAGSYRINEQWSLGAGLDIIYGQGTMKRTTGSGFPPSTLVLPGPTIIPAKGTAIVNVDKADGWAVGFNIGTVYELNENNRFGFSYRYSPEFEAEDDYGQKITLPLPDIAEFSGFHKIENTKFAIHYSLQWIGWSAFDQIEFRNLDASRSPIAAAGAVNGVYTSEYEWQDGWHYSIGGTYYLNTDWTLRAGYMYDTSAQDKVTSISVPDSDRQWLSAGFTYHLGQKSNIDFGFTYLMGDDVNVNETSGVTTISATTHADAILVGLQYSRTF